MSDDASLAVFIAAVALLYATAGQAGGTAFLAVMALAAFPAEQMRPTALVLNIVAAGYATAWLQWRGAIDWPFLRWLLVPALPAAFAGGLVALDAGPYTILTGLLLLAAAGLMVLRQSADDAGGARPPGALAAALAGAASGFLAGLSGIGGGVFLAPLVIALRWVTPRQAAMLSPPFILANSIAGFAGVHVAGEAVPPAISTYALAALCGAALGTAIGERWMSHRLTRYMLATVLVVAGARQLLR